MPTLTIQLPGLPPVDHVLRDEIMTIGRMKENSITLNEDSVSVTHAKIRRKGKDVYLKDLNSTNGTMVNGQSINEALLKDGDRLKFGDVLALYRADPELGSHSPPQASAVVHAPTPAPQTVATAIESKRLVAQTGQSPTAPGAPVQSVPTGKAEGGVTIQQSHSIVFSAGVCAVLTFLIVVLLLYLGGNGGHFRKSSQNLRSSVPEHGSLPDLKRNLKSPDPLVRRQAAAALHRLGPGAGEALPELRGALRDSDPEVRMWSALALVNNKSYDKTEIPILVLALHHANPMLRQVSCLSLALIPYDGAEKTSVVTALSDIAATDKDEEVRKAAASALKIISPE